MAYQVPTELPSALAVNTTWTWERTLTDYPSSEGWSVVAHVVGEQAALALTATNVSGTWRFTATAAETARLVAGVYRVTLVATLGAERRVVEQTSLRVTADPSEAPPNSDLTYAEQMVKALEAELLRRTTNQAVASYTIAGRSFQHESLSDLDRMLNRYRAQVLRQRRAGALPGFAVTFGGVR